MCYIRKRCEGKGKIDINNKIFIITNLCNNKVEHDDIEYKDFSNLMKDKNLKELDFKKNAKILFHILINI